MGTGNKAEMLIAICAVISSIAAVYIAWDQARVMRSQEKADVWPMIQLTHYTSVDDDGGARYALSAQNAGVGPALIEDFAIRFPGAEATATFEDMAEYLFVDELSDVFGPPVWTSHALRGRVLRQGETVSPVGASWSKDKGIEDAFIARVTRFLDKSLPPADVFVCYCSILEDCWVSSTLAHNPRPLPVKSCKDMNRAVSMLMPVNPLITPEKVPSP